MRKSFIERSTENLFHISERSLFAERIARRKGLLQALDARVKIGGIAALVVAAVSSRSLPILAAMLFLALAISMASHVTAALLIRVSLAVLTFTAIVGLPALVLTPGVTIAHLPFGLDLTEQGLRTFGYLAGRAETTAMLSLGLVVSTRWADLVRALRSFGVPLVIVVVLGMTYRYIFVLLRTAQDFFEARRSRRVGELAPADQRRITTAAAGVLLSKSVHLADDVYQAMQSRGFRGELYLMDDPAMRVGDWLALAAFLLLAVAGVWLGR